MTDSLAALGALTRFPGAAFDEASAAFYGKAKANSEALVINKWFMVQAANPAPGALETVKGLMAHEAFDGTNPNRVRSVIGVFASANPTAFHALDGAGYEFIAAQVIAIDQKNPQLLHDVT